MQKKIKYTTLNIRYFSYLFDFFINQFLRKNVFLKRYKFLKREIEQYTPI
ncbi:hypothetical protein A1OE_418 [Candidatus Endolissoclinum faulkneri L2]|uniref:Uncharacterized protein n=1 Tax=Candidatus Endolissoclinum faulkneri L2 TaxID=1193729 RepID=K7ZCI4_9PROT|nr:hypothetical protein A1OE_418 [Candidatus Endolissoclinum faulkneri L2]